MIRILLDVDGVLAGFASAYLDIVHDVTGRRYVLERVTAFDIGTSLGLSAEESSACKRVLGSSFNWCKTLPVLDGAIEGVRRLQQLGEVYIVTSPWNSCASWTWEREAWLKQHFDIPHSRVVHTSAKYLVRGDVFVDDRADAVAKWRDEHPAGLPVLWSTPHNQRESWDGERTNDWARLAALVEAR